MFRYENEPLASASHSSKGAMKIAVGDTVRSLFRSPWKGTVLALEKYGGTATVRVHTDRHGNPIRKPKLRRLHVRWLSVVQ